MFSKNKKRSLANKLFRLTSGAGMGLLISGLLYTGIGYWAREVINASKTSPAAKSPAAKSPAAKSPAAKSPAAKSPAAKSPAAKSPAAKSPAAKSPAAKSPAAKSPAAKSPAAKSPAAKSPAAKSPAAKSPAAKSPAAKSPAAKSPAANSRAAGKASDFHSLFPYTSTKPATGPGGGWFLGGLFMIGIMGYAVWELVKIISYLAPRTISVELESLLDLPEHKRIMQAMKLHPRQVKRLASKARIQHRQLNNKGYIFPDWCLVKAFQMLLLLEEDRQGPQRLLYARQTDFIDHLQEQYNRHKLLKNAWTACKNGQHFTLPFTNCQQEADNNPDMDKKLMEQVYEMNAGLLA